VAEKKMWCVAELDEQYIARMEDVLAVHEKPLSAREPVVCIDEKPVVLHQEIRPPIAMQPGRVGPSGLRIWALRNGQCLFPRWYGNPYVGPDIITRNLTPDKTGRPEGGRTLEQFKEILRHGTDFDRIHLGGKRVASTNESVRSDDRGVMSSQEAVLYPNH
jgi:hypothetical protein